MKFHEFKFNYKEKKDFRFDLYSDLHIDAHGCKRKELKESLDVSYKEADGIMLNGDIFSCLLPKDFKRFTLAHAFIGRDDVLDCIIDYVADFLAPYADKIMFIGMGNHESSVLKFHSTNPIARLCRQLKDHGGDVRFGDYQNFVRLKFEHGDNGRTRNYLMWINHGMGAGAKRSRGGLEWDIVYSKFQADLYWQGHNHMGQTDDTGQRVFVDQNGNIKTTYLRGLRTPGWEDTIEIRGYEDPFDLKYGEERHGTPCAPSGHGILSLNLRGHEKIKHRVFIEQY